MTWLTPATGLILAAAVVPPLLLLYFLKLRRRNQTIASTLLWQRSVEDLHANAPFQRLRANLLLFLQLFALLLLALAVMQPQIMASSPKGGKTVLLLDNSASMTATDTEDGRSRLEEAKDRARERIEAMHGGGLLARGEGETMILAFADHAEVFARFSKSRTELLRAIDLVQPTHGRTTVGEALKLARAFTTNVDPDSDRPVDDPADLELFSDGRIADLDDQVLRGEKMVFHRLGSRDADNVSIGTLAVERPYDRPTAVEVFTSMLNFGPEPVTCDVQLSVGTTALRVQEVSLPAARTDPASGRIIAGRNNVVFTPFDQPRDAVIEIANLRADDLDADNVAWVVVPPPKQLRVALVDPKSFLLRGILEGMPLESLDILTARQFETRARGSDLDRYDVIVFDDYAPAEDLLPPARYLTFGPTPPIEGLNEFGEGEAQIVLNSREEHPVLRFVRLDNLYVSNTTLLQPADDVQVLVRGTQGPLVVAMSRGPLQVLHVAFDPLESNWPFQRSFVAFVYNAIDYLGHLGDGLTTRGLEVGEAITARLPAAATDIRMRPPEGPEEAIDSSDPTMVSWGPVRRTGLHVLTWEEPGADEPLSRTFAVNLLDEEEGHIAAAEQIEIGQDTVAGVESEATAYTPLWPWALGLCLLVLMFEWWVYHKRAFL